MALVSLALRFALKRPDIVSMGRHLFFGPHPDDIEIGAGATAARLAREGKRVRFVICTDGRFGSQSIPPEELVGMRRKEAVASAHMLGVDDVVFLPFSDGALYDCNELVKAMAREIASFQPDVIYAPDPFVASECHQDHLNVGHCARRLACSAPYGGIMEGLGSSAAPVKAIAFYMSAKCNRIVKSKGCFALQGKAIKAHRSQFKGNESVFTYLALRSLQYGLRRACLHAEAFRVLSDVDMHCLPERGL